MQRCQEARTEATAFNIGEPVCPVCHPSCRTERCRGLGPSPKSNNQNDCFQPDQPFGAFEGRLSELTVFYSHVFAEGKALNFYVHLGNTCVRRDCRVELQDAFLPIGVALGFLV